MENFIERLNTLLDNDPFSDIDWSLLSHNDYEVSQLYLIDFCHGENLSFFFSTSSYWKNIVLNILKNENECEKKEKQNQ